MIIATIRKELQLLARDRAAVFRLLVLPLAFIALFGSVFNSAEHGAKHARPIAVWHAPRAKLGPAITAALDGSGVFAVAQARSADEVRALVASEQLDVGLIIPEDFDPGAGHPAELVIDSTIPKEPAQLLFFAGRPALPASGGLRVVVSELTHSPAHQYRPSSMRGCIDAIDLECDVRCRPIDGPAWSGTDSQVWLRIRYQPIVHGKHDRKSIDDDSDTTHRMRTE